MNRELEYFCNELTRMMKNFGIWPCFRLPTPSLKMVVQARMTVTDTVKILDSRPYDWEIGVDEKEICFNPEQAVAMVMRMFMDDFCRNNLKKFFRPIEPAKHPLIEMAEIIEDSARKRGEIP